MIELDDRTTNLPASDSAVRRRVCVVGSGTRFLSGISYYTHRLTEAFAGSHRASSILMRQLLPTRLYPGRARVNQPLTSLKHGEEVAVFDGVDWYWLPSMLKAISWLRRERPQIMILQWWTGTVLHSYLALALIARLLGTKIIIEFHEVLDTGEARLPLARWYVGLVAPLVVRLASGFVIHSEFDRPHLEKRYRLGSRPVALIPHGPYDHHQAPTDAPDQVTRSAPADCCNLLFFGVIRPYKGLEDLIRAFDNIPADEIEGYWLTIVGETWEGWTLPAELVAQSHYKERITFVNRYVPDEEVTAFFAGADAVVLPYLRSSASGPLHIAMSQGLPVVVTEVGGLVEAVGDYEGATLVPPSNPKAIGTALKKVAGMRGERFVDAHTWAATVARFDELFNTLDQTDQALTNKAKAKA